MRGWSAARKGCSGFSMVELMVTLAIAGILAAVAIPGYSRWLPDYRLKKAARDLYSNLQLTKLTAIRQNANCVLTYSSGPDKYTISGIGKTVVLDDYGSGVGFDGPGGETFSTGDITFNPMGISNAGYAYLSTDSNYYRVGCLTSGVIRLERWNGSAWE